MCSSVQWNEQFDLLASIEQNTKLNIFLYPQSAFLDNDLLRLSTVVKEYDSIASQNDHRYLDVVSFQRDQIKLANERGSSITNVVSPFHILLHTYVNENKLDNALKLCRLNPKDANGYLAEQRSSSALSLCAAFTAMALNKRNLDMAEIGYAAVEIFERVIYIKNVKKIYEQMTSKCAANEPVNSSKLMCAEAVKKAEISLLCGSYLEAESILLNAGFVVRCLFMHLNLFHWMDAVQIAKKYDRSCTDDLNKFLLDTAAALRKERTAGHLFRIASAREPGQTYVRQVHLLAVIVELDWYVLAEFEMFNVDRLLVAVPGGSGRVGGTRFDGTAVARVVGHRLVGQRAVRRVVRFVQRCGRAAVRFDRLLEQNGKVCEEVHEKHDRVLVDRTAAGRIVAGLRAGRSVSSLLLGSTVGKDFLVTQQIAIVYDLHRQHRLTAFRHFLTDVLVQHLVDSRLLETVHQFDLAASLQFNADLLVALVAAALLDDRHVSARSKAVRRIVREQIQIFPKTVFTAHQRTASVGRFDLFEEIVVYLLLVDEQLLLRLERRSPIDILSSSRSAFAISSDEFDEIRFS
ncbi:hypothetical protein L1887_62316 [Cichorium endivia]|nr:hypothetical protein L1887_62316 [Cichorium endivia]